MRIIVIFLLFFPAIVQPLAVQAEQKGAQEAAIQKTSANAIDLSSLRLPASFSHSRYLVRYKAEYFPRYLERAAELYYNSKPEDALKKLQEIERSTAKLRFLSSPEKIYLLQAFCLLAVKEHSEALKAFEKALRFKGSSSDLLFLKALSEVENGKIEVALQTLQEALWFNKFKQIQPSDAHLTLAEIHLLLGNTEKAQSEYSAALANSTDSFAARMQLAQLQLARGKKTEAIGMLREALAQNPESLDAQLYLAKALMLDADRFLDQNSTTEAKQILKKLSAKDLSNEKEIEISSQLIKAHLLSNELKEAEKLVHKTLKRSPASIELNKLKEQLALERQAKASTSLESEPK